MKWFICLCIAASFGLNGCATDEARVLPDRESWQPRTQAGPPSAREKLALEVVNNGRKRVDMKAAKAYFEREEDGCAVVAVEVQASMTPPTVEKTCYRIRDGVIEAQSYPNYIQVVDKVREGYAHEVAKLARRGQNPDRPLIYEGKFLYSPMVEEGCTVIVTEYDTNRNALATYDFHDCDE